LTQIISKKKKEKVIICILSLHGKLEIHLSRKKNLIPNSLQNES